ncbi:hypothetical protein BHE74_00052931 [Ensete ventricosum]|nr:hypothetical protein GW17_00046317 [Ensete ventricosum]RWW41578.1 hypothetical protein BHE74_00052931 [Ensete ventricosum]RZS19605.1 hypothetical protein BHM03_00052021 [Ensete ventricosum]
MGLNRVELFYAFLLRFHSEGSKEEGRLAPTSPYAGPVAHGQAAAKAPCKGATGCNQGQPAREASDARRGPRLLAEAPPPGTAACSATPARGPSCRMLARGCHPRPALPPAGATAPAAGVAAPWQGDCRWARATVACAGATAAAAA